jgi:hypothetical protein
MERHSNHSRPVVAAFSIKADTRRLDQQKEHVVDILTRPLVALGVMLYVVTMWRLERNDEAVR